MSWVNHASTSLDDVATPPASTALTVSSEHPSALLIERCSYWKKLVAAHKFMYMFLAVLKRCVLTTQMDQAEQSILKYVHQTAFTDDYGHLQKNDQVSKSSPLSQLNPFIDPSGLIRPRGRIETATFLKLCVLLFYCPLSTASPDSSLMSATAHLVTQV